MKIKQESAWVCVRLGCEYLYDGHKQCPACGHEGIPFSEVIEALEYPVFPVNAPISLEKRKPLTATIQ